jgi:hypothetical protein
MNPHEPVNLSAAEALARVRELSERRLSEEEFNAYVDAPMSKDELEELLASIAWFIKRYPTPGERLAAARRATAQWVQSSPPSEMDDGR